MDAHKKCYYWLSRQLVLLVTSDLSQCTWTCDGSLKVFSILPAECACVCVCA